MTTYDPDFKDTPRALPCPKCDKPPTIFHEPTGIAVSCLNHPEFSSKIRGLWTIEDRIDAIMLYNIKVAEYVSNGS